MIVGIGHQKALFLFDTGANRSVIFPSAVKALHLNESVVEQVAYGGNGKVAAHEAAAVDVRFGNGVLPVGTFLVMPVANERALGSISGNLGADIIDNWSFRVNRSAGQLEVYNEEGCLFEEPPLKGDWHKANLSPFSTQPVFRIFIDGEPFMAMLDTGAGQSAIRASVAKKLGLDLSHDRSISLLPFGTKTITGRLHRVDDVGIANQPVGPMTFAVVPDNPFLPEVIVGNDFLQRWDVFVSSARRRMFFRPAVSP